MSSGSLGASPKPPSEESADHGAPVENLRRLGKYEIQKKIGAGGMGTVYLAFDPELKRPVALKVLPKEKAENPTLVKRFKSEAQAAAHLKHENIVTVYDAGEIGGHLYIALEYVEGADVYHMIARRGPFPVKRSIEIIKQAAQALQHAHQQNIVHRDIKPSNLLITRDRTVKLTDLGLARSLDETTTTSITRAGTTVGTVDYMAPEQARDSRAADIKSDIYSLGCTWYHMLTGDPPYPEGSLTNKLAAHANNPLPDPRQKNPAVSEAVVAVMHRMMAKKPEDRYQTPAALLKDLENDNLKRDTISDEVLAALAGDGEIGGSSRRSQRASPAAGPLPPPPPVRKEPARQHAAQARALRFNAVKIATWAAVIIVAGLVLWSLAAWLGSSSKPAAPPVDQNPFSSTNGESKTKKRTDQSGDSKTQASAADGSAVAEKSDESAVSQNGSAEPESVETRESADLKPSDVDLTAEVATADQRAVAMTSVREGERGYLPSWIAQKAPADAAPESASKGALPELTVGRSAGGPGRFDDITDAFQELPESGAVIRLLGEGPFLLHPVRITQCRDLRITAAAPDATRPVILCVPSPNGRSPPSPIPNEVGPGVPDRILDVSDGSLTLQGVDFVVLREPFPVDHPLTLVAVGTGDLIVQHCSVTLEGTPTQRITAFCIDGRVAGVEAQRSPQRAPLGAHDVRPQPPAADSPAVRVLLDRLFVRGGNLSVIQINRAAVDFVAHNCLFATGRAPVLTLAAPSNPQPVNRSGQRTRSLRFLSCTAYATDTALELFAGVPGGLTSPLLEAGDPPPTTILVSNSLFGAGSPSAARDAKLVSLVTWPRQQNQAADQPLFRNLHWTLQASLFLGWQHLVSTADDDSFDVQGAASWQNVWRGPVENTRFQPEHWPADPIAVPGNVTPQQLDAATVPVADVHATDGGPPGCLSEVLAIPSSAAMSLARAVAERPMFPSNRAADRSTGRQVAVDLEKQDLGLAVSGGEWPDGTVFVASGSGLRYSSPLRVTGKRLRIQFVQSDGPPLLVMPRSRDWEPGQAFITVRNGDIEIVDAPLKIPATQRSIIPQWFLHCDGGSFSLVRCRLQGPMLPNSVYRGAVRWTRSRTADAVSKTGLVQEHFGRIADCYLSGRGTVLQADLPRRTLTLTNSLLVSPDDVFDLTVSAADPAGNATVALKRCTLSAGDTFFRVRAAPSPAGAGSRDSAPLWFFVDETVFAPPLIAGPSSRVVGMRGEENGPVQPTLISAPGLLPGDGRPNPLIQWWGTANGYAPEIARFVETSTGRSRRDQTFETGWRAFWGAGHVRYPVTGPQGVLLKDELPQDASAVEPLHFQLHPTSQASRWAAGGQPLGADVVSLQPPDPKKQFGTPAAESSSKSTPREKANSQKPKRRKPDF